MVEQQRAAVVSRGRVKRRRRTEEELALDRAEETRKRLEVWSPKTELGKTVRDGKIESLDEIFQKNIRIMEAEIVDTLVSDLQEKLVDYKKTSKVRRAGRMFAFRASVLVGDGNKYVGLGTATDKERWPAIKKATRKAKLNLVQIKKGCGSWECMCGTPHTVPFKVNGRSASARISLMPAPRGTGLVVGDNIKDVLKFVGIGDVWSKTRGNTGTKLNFVKATIDALSRASRMKFSEDIARKVGGEE